MNRFHLAIPVKNLEESITFYTERFGCDIGRKSERSAVLNFFNHQVVLHVKENYESDRFHNSVDSVGVPVPHFGMLLEGDEWNALRDRLVKAAREFVVGPYVRYEGTSGEQATMFFYDPSGNALEFKSFNDPKAAFSPWTEKETQDYNSEQGKFNAS